MHASRKRQARLTIALTLALLLAGALVYTTFSAASPEVTPGQIVRAADPEQSYKLGGWVEPGSVQRSGETLRFRVRDPKGSASVPVVYSGTVPDPFREGREVLLTVRRQGPVFVGERDSLVTKCPSKFTAERPA